MTPFGFAVLGFVAAVIVIAIRAEGRRLDSIDPPAWVNDGRPLKPLTFQNFVEAIDVALWEAELDGRDSFVQRLIAEAQHREGEDA